MCGALSPVEVNAHSKHSLFILELISLMSVSMQMVSNLTMQASVVNCY